MANSRSQLVRVERGTTNRYGRETPSALSKHRDFRIDGIDTFRPARICHFGQGCVRNGSSRYIARIRGMQWGVGDSKV